MNGKYRASMYMRPAAIWAMEMTGPASVAAAPIKAAAAK